MMMTKCLHHEPCEIVVSFVDTATKSTSSCQISQQGNAQADHSHDVSKVTDKMVERRA